MIGTLLRYALLGGTITALTSSAAALALARREGIAPAAPLNAVSHWLWGRRAAHQDAVSPRYTATGVLTNHAACVLWAGVYELLRTRLRPTPRNAIVTGAAVSALAYMVDYHLVPSRLTPGSELRLGNRSLAILYGVIAAPRPRGARMPRPPRRREST